MTKTVAYIGNFEPEYSTENDVRKAFEHLGWRVVKLQENKVTVRDVQKAVTINEGGADLLLITGTWDSLPLVEMLDVFHYCAKFGIPTATLHLDTFWGKSRNGRKWWREVMFHTAYLFTADGDYQEFWKGFGKNHIWLPPGVRHDAVGIGKARPEYECDVAFVGSNGHGYHEDVWGYRRELVDKLREICQKNGWSFKNPGGDNPKIPRDHSMNDFYASAKVTVGDSLCLLKEDARYWSDRVPEALGRGGYLIMPQINALKTQGLRVDTYEWGNWDDLENRIKVALDDPEVRTQVADFNLKAVADGHTYVSRVETILREVEL